MKINLFIILPLLSCSAAATEIKNDYFKNQDACFVLTDIATGKTVEEINAKRCAERFSPCSSFKIAAAVMAFDAKILKDEKQIIKWNGTHFDRQELNRDQTPLTWMSNSVVWVTQWIVPQLTKTKLDKFMSDFAYGNRDFSGGMTQAWLSSTLKISADEQIRFLERLWAERLPVSQRAMALTKQIIFIEDRGHGHKLYGKTGTGCIDPNCTQQPARMLGWFVGIFQTSKKAYAFAANASDRQAEKEPAGLRVRSTVRRLLSDLNLN